MRILLNWPSGPLLSHTVRNWSRSMNVILLLLLGLLCWPCHAFAPPAASWAGPTRGLKKLGAAGEPVMLMERLLQLFKGDFDNHKQVVADRQAGLLPGEGGGHEHIHCKLVPVTRLAAAWFAASKEAPHAVVSAMYYFDGDPSRVFRYRIYGFFPLDESEATDRGSVVMKLWRLVPEAEASLRARGYDLVGWDPSMASKDTLEAIPGCDIYWDQVGGAFRGLMGMDDKGTWVSSQMVEGLKILVKDELLLEPEALSVHDRGYDKDGNFVYGNQRGVPYKMLRVTADSDLLWTLGSA
ncbi:unnamed protein product [Chrysoparadoxa australica]